MKIITRLLIIGWMIGVCIGMNRRKKNTYGGSKYEMAMNKLIYGYRWDEYIDHIFKHNAESFVDNMSPKRIKVMLEKITEMQMTGEKFESPVNLITDEEQKIYDSMVQMGSVVTSTKEYQASDKDSKENSELDIVEEELNETDYLFKTRYENDGKSFEGNLPHEEPKNVGRSFQDPRSDIHKYKNSDYQDHDNVEEFSFESIKSLEDPEMVYQTFLDPYNTTQNDEFKNAFKEAQTNALEFLDILYKLFTAGYNINAHSEFYYATSEDKIFKLKLHNLQDLAILIKLVAQKSIQFYTDFYMDFYKQKDIPFASVRRLLFAILGPQKWQEHQRSVCTTRYTLILKNAFPISNDLAILIERQRKYTYKGQYIQDIYIYQDLDKLPERLISRGTENQASFLKKFTTDSIATFRNMNLNVMAIFLQNQNYEKIELFLKLFYDRGIYINASQHDIEELKS